MEVEQNERTSVPSGMEAANFATVVPVPRTPGPSEWKIGFTAGIAFALTVLAGPALFYGMRGANTWMEDAQRQATEDQSRAEDPVVSKEFSDAARTVADLMETEAVVLKGPPDQVKTVESDMENRIEKLSTLAHSTHESQILFELQQVHSDVDSCLSNALFSDKPGTSTSTCSDKVPSKEEIEKAVNTPYKRY